MQPYPRSPCTLYRPCPYAPASASAAAHGWAGALGYSCLSSHLLLLVFLVYLEVAVPALPWLPPQRGGGLLSFSCLGCAGSRCFPEKPLWPEPPGPFTGGWRTKTVCDRAGDSCSARKVHESAWNFSLKRHFSCYWDAANCITWPRGNNVVPGPAFLISLQNPSRWVRRVFGVVPALQEN